MKYILFAFTAVFFALSAYVYAAETAGVIRAIEIEGLTRISTEEMSDLFSLETGDVFDPVKLKLGLRRAFKKNIFIDINVESEPYDGGVKLKYTVEEVPQIDKVWVKGAGYIRSGRVKEAFAMKDEGDFRREDLKKAEKALLEFYADRGFPHAEVRIDHVRSKRPSMVDITLNINEGTPMKIRRLDVPQGTGRYLRFIEGSIIDKDILKEDIERVRQYYKKMNYISPVIGYQITDDNDLIVTAETGPKLEIALNGNTKVNSRDIRKEIILLDDEEISDETIQESVERVRVLYLSKGYYYSQVAAGVERQGDIITVSVYIFEGEKTELKKVVFKGVTINNGSLPNVIPLKENEVYDDSLLEASREALERFYNALGYIHMKISEINKTFAQNGKELDLEFVIDEGVQTKLSDIVIKGNKGFTAEAIIGSLKIKRGSPYNLVDIGDARYRIISLYGTYGYLEASVDVETRVDGSEAFLTFIINENVPSVIGKIIIQGNYRTKQEVIRREFRTKEGDLYNYEEIQNIRQRLYKLGIFNEVSVDIIDSGINIDGKREKDLLVRVREGNAGAVELSLGYGDYEKIRGGFGVSYRNVQGMNRHIGMKTEVSDVEERFVFNFKEPRLLKTEIPLNVYILKEDTRSVNLDTNDVKYKIDRITFLAGIQKEMQEGVKVGLNYEYSLVDTYDVDPGVILSKEDTGTLGISSFSPSLFFDTRDDQFNPVSGALVGITIKFASPLFLSETQFLKGIFQGSYFYELKKGLVFAMSLRSGAAVSIQGEEELPLVERFFLGGRTTVRGYTQDNLGPKGEDGSPTGGNVFVLGNGEFRYSIGKSLGLVAFLDGGNVWQLAEDTEVDIKYTVGGGLRYNTPVGPLRLDYGYKLNREEDESSGELHFTFGHAF